MKRTYNHKISQRANERLRKRARAVQIQKQMLALTGVIIISLAILLGSSICAFASSNARKELHKYYTSIQIQNGDTLWDLSDSYAVDGLMNRSDFITEVTSLNHLSDGQIHAGDYIVVPYYSAEIM